MTKLSRVASNYTPLPWQAGFHGRTTRFGIYAVHRQAGKSRGAVEELVLRALQAPLDSQSPWEGAFLAPFRNQAKGNAWTMCKRACEPLRVAGGCEIHEADLVIEMNHNKARIRLAGADNAEALRGPGYNFLVVDEVAGVAPDVWESVLQPTLARRLGQALFIGTPNGINLFSELFFKGQSLPDWTSKRITVYDTGVIPAQEIKRLESTMAPTAFAREYLCDFSAAADDQIMSLTDVEVASKRRYTEKDIQDAPRIMGVDPARFGDDRTVIAKRQGLQMFPMISMRGADNMEVVGRISHEITNWQPDAVFIDSGAGAGIIDRLRQLGFKIVEVPFGGRANRNDLFTNRRAEMWFTMRDWILAGGAIPDSPVLKQELATPKFHFDAQNRRALESKDDIKKRLQGGASPDEGDAAVLTHSFPVKKGDKLQEAREQLRKERSRDMEMTYDNAIDWHDRLNSFGRD